MLQRRAMKFIEKKVKMYANIEDKNYLSNVCGVLGYSRIHSVCDELNGWRYSGNDGKVVAGSFSHDSNCLHELYGRDGVHSKKTQPSTADINACGKYNAQTAN